MDLNEINTQLIVAEEEIKLLKGGKKIAAQRARKALLNIKKQTDLIRKEILQNTKKDKPVKEKPVEKEILHVNDVKHHVVNEEKVDVKPKKKTQKVK